MTHAISDLLHFWGWFLFGFTLAWPAVLVLRWLLRKKLRWQLLRSRRDFLSAYQPQSVPSSSTSTPPPQALSEERVPTFSSS